MIRQVAQMTNAVDNFAMHTSLLTFEEPRLPARPASAEKLRMRGVVRAWLEALAIKHGGPEALANISGVPRATIFRALKEDGMSVMSTENISRIAQSTGSALPPALSGARNGHSSSGFAEEELLYVSVPPPFADLVPGDDQGVWINKSRALELYGYQPGDMLLVDFGVRPVFGDVVCAQIYNLERGTAETVIRVFEPPYLTTKSLDMNAAWRPQLIDNERVVVRGTVIRSIRERRDTSNETSDIS